MRLLLLLLAPTIATAQDADLPTATTEPLASELVFETPVGLRTRYHLQRLTTETWPHQEGVGVQDTLALVISRTMTEDQIRAATRFFRSPTFDALWAVEDASYQAGYASAMTNWYRSRGRSRTEPPARVAAVRRLLEAQARPELEAARYRRTLDHYERSHPTDERLPAVRDKLLSKIDEASAGPAVTDQYVDYILDAYPDLDTAVFDGAAAFYESAAGRAFVDASKSAVDAVAFAYQSADMTYWAPSRDLPLGPAPPPPAVERQPELIGGLAGLNARVVYPKGARSDGVEGRVIVQFVVDTDGTVQDATVLRTPDERLSQAALRAVLTSQFTPGTLDGRPVRVRFTMPINFRLD